MRSPSPRSAFTMMELMVAVAIVGILAAVGLPMYAHYLKKTRTAEVPEHLSALYQGAVLYFREPRTQVSPDGLVNTEHCTTRDASRTPEHPSSDPQRVNFATIAVFSALNFSVAMPIRFGYSVVGTNVCNAHEGEAYTFRAEGDLDDDGVMSTFDLAVGVNSYRELYRSPGINAINEFE